MNSLGTITYWGFSSAQNIVDLFNLSFKTDQSILLIGCGDCRVIMQLLAKHRRSGGSMLSIYVVENSLELYARHMLLLSVAMEDAHHYGLQERSELFLELFGNLHIRKFSDDYLRAAADGLIRLVTSSDGACEGGTLFDLSCLKFKERDLLEGVLKLWRGKNIPAAKLFDGQKCWELRLRQALGVRYDSRTGVYDWDYHMKLAERGAKLVNSHEYREWRETGLAFDLRDKAYSISNRSLASGHVFNMDGQRHLRVGYWGDILVGPYLSFGLTSNNSELLRIGNNVYQHTSTELALYNVTELCYELEHGKQYEPANTGQPKAATIVEEDETAVATETNDDVKLADQLASDNCSSNRTKIAQLDNVKVTFLSPTGLLELAKKTRFERLFDSVFVGCSLVSLLSADLANTFNTDNADFGVVVETPRFLLDADRDKLDAFDSKLMEIAQRCSLVARQPFSSFQDSFALFKLNSQN